MACQDFAGTYRRTSTGSSTASGRTSLMSQIWSLYEDCPNEKRIVVQWLVVRRYVAVPAAAGTGERSGRAYRAARAAAGQDFRATFVNLCLPAGVADEVLRGAVPGRQPRRVVGRRGAPAAGGTDRQPRPVWLVRLSLQGVRQPVLARDPSAFVVGAAHERRHHHHRHQLRVGDAAGNHRRADNAGTQSARHQIRHHQPRARRSRSGRGGAAKPLRREGGDGRGRLGVHAAAARHSAGGVPKRDIAVGPEDPHSPWATPP